MEILNQQQILERRKEIDPVRNRPHTITIGELRGMAF